MTPAFLCTKLAKSSGQNGFAEDDALDRTTETEVETVVSGRDGEAGDEDKPPRPGPGGTERPLRFRAAGSMGPSDAAFLAEASRLLASSLDYETTLATVAELALPHLGAWCFVDIIEDDGRMRRLAVVHPDPEKQMLARSLEDGWPPEREDPMGVPAVVRTRCSRVIPRVTDGMLVNAAHSEENLAHLRALGIGSLMVVPLVARGVVLGAVTFVMPESGYHYGESDLALAEDLATRSAIAVDNARLFRQAQLARAEAEAANQAKSLFLATMSHEIRTPINAITGYAELLEMELAGPLTAEQRAQVERIQLSSRHLLGLVNEVLDLAKVESGQMSVEHQRAIVPDVVLDALALISPQAAERGILVENHGGDPDLCYVGDEDRVRQILVNLLSNAAKFTPAGGRVTVRCGAAARPGNRTRLPRDGRWVFIEVEDDGDGIAPEEIHGIFAPFYQGTSGLTRREGGTGLGLTISRQLARLMGGDLTVRSTPGQGSCFTLWLPASPDALIDPEHGLGADPDVELQGLATAARRLLRSLDPIIYGLGRRLRADDGMPAIAGAPEAEVVGHAAGLVTGLAQALILVGESGGTSSPGLRDASKVQRLTAELHGAQRCRQGWREEALEREFGHLREELEGVLHGPGTEPARRILARLLEQVERLSRRGFQLAEAAGRM